MNPVSVLIVFLAGGVAQEAMQIAGVIPQSPPGMDWQFYAGIAISLVAFAWAIRK